MKYLANNRYTSLILIIVLCVATSCNSAYQPKPTAYYAIELPKSRTYIPFNLPNYPYTFEYPNDAAIVQDSTFFTTNEQNNDWINVDYPAYNCKLYLSYNKVNGTSLYKVKDAATGIYKDSLGTNTLDKLRNDAFNLTAKHIYKSSQIIDEKISTPNGISGVLFKVGGDAASPIQFFVTDSTTHFLRGALYYNAQPKQDSTKPVTEFLLKDIMHICNTLQWKPKP